MKPNMVKYKEVIKTALSTELNELYDLTDALEQAGVDPLEFKGFTKMEERIEELRKNFLADKLTPMDESGIIMVLERRKEVADKKLEEIKTMITSMNTVISEIQSELTPNN